MTSDELLKNEKMANKNLQIVNAQVSHELRNPLNGIVANNLERKQLLFKMKEYLSSTALVETKENVISWLNPVVDNLIEGTEM